MNVKNVRPPASSAPNENGSEHVMDTETMEKMFGPKYDILAAQKTRRFIKTHLPFNLMPHNIKQVGAKVVYVARNPKDVVASYYHFKKVNPNYQFAGDFDSFLQYFMDDLSKLLRLPKSEILRF